MRVVHAADYTKANIGTGSRILTRRPFVFETGSIRISTID